MAENITVLRQRHHNKAAETYVDAIFQYEKLELEVSVPIVYRRTGLDLHDQAEIDAHVASVFEYMRPTNWAAWRALQQEFWRNSRADVTKPFFDILSADVRWVPSQDLPPNKNPARRLQDIKELGYTLATRNVGRDYQYLLLPIPRVHESGYEYWSGALRSKILTLHRNYDAYEGRATNPNHLLPDHKFPEIRWDRDTARVSLEGLSEREILSDFQPLNNQRNQQKREACRACRRTGIRPYPMGIKFYYAGDEHWPENVPSTGKAAEQGCYGCGWYDLEAWRQALIARATGGDS